MIEKKPTDAVAQLAARVDYQRDCRRCIGAIHKSGYLYRLNPKYKIVGYHDLSVIVTPFIDDSGGGLEVLAGRGGLQRRVLNH
jgi:hypothetical protein